VNGQEIEYAGDPQGHPNFAYRWDFDPGEHRPLLGGNVSLQVSAYDNDRVSGPKKALSPAIVWTFPGIQHLAQKTLEKVQETRQVTASRLDPNQRLAAQSVLEKVLEMSPLLMDNPAMSPALLGLNQTMSFQLAQHASQDQGQPNQQEAQLHRRHEWTLQIIEHQAKQILGTIEASQWVQRLNEMAERASKQEISQSQWSELYQALQEHFRKTETQPAFREKMLSKLNQAELASQMGDPKTASKLLKEMAEEMRSQPSAMGASGPNPFAERFMQLMEELQDLINKQLGLLSELNPSRQSLVDLHDFRASLPQHSDWKAHRQWLEDISRTTQSGEPVPPELLGKNANPQDPVARGRLLHQIYSDLTMIITGRPPNRPWPQVDSLPSDLQNPWEKLLPSLADPTGLSFSPEHLLGQEDLSKRAEAFRKDFEADMAPMLPGPNLTPLTLQGEAYARQAFQRMGAKHPHELVQQDMMGASNSWKALLQQLQNLQQAAQQAAGQRQQALKIGADGKLQLSSQGEPKEEGDGRFDQRDHDIEIPLPKDFQSNKAIEERLQESLRKTRNEEELSRFKDYMLDLLE